MKDEEKPLIYRRLMAIKPSGWTLNGWTVQAGVSRNFFQDLASRGRARSDIIEKVISAAGVDPKAFYAAQADLGSDSTSMVGEQRAAFTVQSASEPHDVPVRGTALGGDFETGQDGELRFAELTEVYTSETVDYIRRPASLARKRDIYALTIVGTSMQPRWDPGDPAYIDPNRAPSIEDDVAVQLKAADGEDGDRVASVLIKRLRKRTTRYVELEQFNPPIVFRVEATDIAAIHRVIPRKELAYT
jgi:phage repressor protein C with HTH and peptisase S24 domain